MVARPADALVVVGNRVANDALFRELEAKGVSTAKIIGDAEAPGLIVHAIYAGHRAARELGEPEREIPFRRHLPRFVTTSS